MRVKKSLICAERLLLAGFHTRLLCFSCVLANKDDGFERGVEHIITVLMRQYHKSKKFRQLFALNHKYNCPAYMHDMAERGIWRIRFFRSSSSHPVEESGFWRGIGAWRSCWHDAPHVRSDPTVLLMVYTETRVTHFPHDDGRKAPE